MLGRCLIERKEVSSFQRVSADIDEGREQL